MGASHYPTRYLKGQNDIFILKTIVEKKEQRNPEGQSRPPLTPLTKSKPLNARGGKCQNGYRLDGTGHAFHQWVEK